ncbi:MAG: hypothetical protein JWR03_24 [Cohnella sp.]|nr:hypothetical protein [Cohnella sp.]
MVERIRNQLKPLPATVVIMSMLCLLLAGCLDIRNPMYRFPALLQTLKSFPSRLCRAICAHSAALWTYSSTDDFIDQRDCLFANETFRRKRDPLLLADGSRLKENRVYLDAGDQDRLAEKDRQMYELLRSKHVQAAWSIHRVVMMCNIGLANWTITCFYAGAGR